MDREDPEPTHTHIIIMEFIAQFTLIIFGIFLIGSGFLMLLKPTVVRRMVRKAGSTALIHYTELSFRMVPAISFILYADYSHYPTSFKFIGWYILVTSIILMFIPHILHNKISNQFADFLTPGIFQLFSPLAFILGGLLIYVVS